jgi:hypothetical protein
MNVYDFDKTIYDGDSTVHFWLFCSRRHPGVFVRCLPRLMKGAVLYAFGRIPKEDWKERFFSFLNYLPSNETMVSSFWEIHFAKIKKWYLDQKQESDVIISASPVFLLGPVSRKLGVALIATEVDPASGRFGGPNCSGSEKVRRFRREYPDAFIDEFYTDSKKDLPLASIAGKAYFVRKNTIREMKTE